MALSKHKDKLDINEFVVAEFIGKRVMKSSSKAADWELSSRRTPREINKIIANFHSSTTPQRVLDNKQNP